ncbi:TlpA disulfide reductase family protein [Pontibacter sp. G13]|uniref:TlpA family protein disulfide reductase n=1 Tax=Pontibacter sp. G13 TaxID=3074898 RepID=UPI00288BD107|nr:TlpA disulfide reductase family protein [Pontibacter sp. G13]WNJ20784.1 TlpA disulfide reductase family protein [Pontibacter sp. G13]
MLQLACSSGGEGPEVQKVSPSELDKLISDHPQSYVVVNFYTTYCKPCLEEIPELAKFQQDSDREADVLLVSMDEPAVSKLFLAQYLERCGVDFVTYHLDPTLAEEFMVKYVPDWDRSIPVNLIFTQGGRLVEKTGMTNPSEIRMIIHQDQMFHR